LAKVANHVAKHDLTKVGVFLMDQPTVQESILRDLPVEKIWGIGHQLSQSLGRHGILTAWDLCCADDDWIRKNYSIVVLRTVWELRGLPCLELEEISALRKSIITSKSFGRAVMLWEELAEALSAYTARAAEKLRKQKSLASHLGVFIESKRQEGIRGYFNQTFLTLPQPTSFTPTLIHYAKPMLHKLFHTGLRYKKVGIILDGLVDEKSFQLDLFEENKVQREKQQMLMKLLDQTNRHFGKQVLRIAAEGIAQPWKMKQLNRSLRFTTRWDELLSIQI
jgi:DNA polymerase V